MSLSRVINTPRAFNRAAETLFLGHRNTRERLDLSHYMRPRLEHATQADPAPRTSRAHHPEPCFDARIEVYVEPPKAPSKPSKAPTPSFRPCSLPEGAMWQISCAVTRYPLFQVRGTARHAEREAQRYCEHYGIEITPPPYRLKRTFA